MKSSGTLSLFLLLPSIYTAALPLQLIDNGLASAPSSSKRDTSGNLAPRSPQPGDISPEAAASITDDPSLDPSSFLKRTISARNPQGPDSNPGEFTGFDLSRNNPANHHTSSGSSSSSSAGGGEDRHNVTVDINAVDPNAVDGTSGRHHDRPPGREVMTVEGQEMGHHRYHNASRHHKSNGTHHEHRKEGILTEFNAHGEHIVVYNGTHYPNGTNYRHANKTENGGEVVGDVVVAGDEVVVYRQPSNETCHHCHYYHNETDGSTPTATGFWLPSGTGWIPSGAGRPRHHRKVPSPGNAGFRGPKSRMRGASGKEAEFISGTVEIGKELFGK